MNTLLKDTSKTILYFEWKYLYLRHKSANKTVLFLQRRELKGSIFVGLKRRSQRDPKAIVNCSSAFASGKMNAENGGCIVETRYIATVGFIFQTSHCTRAIRDIIFRFGAKSMRIFQLLAAALQYAYAFNGATM